MISQFSRTFLRDGGSAMNAVATVEGARGVARSLVDRERSRAGSLERARASIARKLNVGQGTFENLIRGRLKKIDAVLRDKLQAVLVREIETELQRLTHELEVARQCGTHPACEQVVEIETHLSAVRQLLTGP